MQEKESKSLWENGKAVIRTFSSLSDAKYHQSLYMKLTVLFCSIVIAIVMAYAYRLQRDAMSRILVVDNAGELRKVRAEKQDRFYLTLLCAHCEQSGIYMNSFDAGSINVYREKSQSLCNLADLKRIWAMYENQGAYLDAANRGVCYRYTFKEMQKARNLGGNEYQVQFWGILEIIDGTLTKRVKITSQGIAMRVEAHWPSNVTGYFWRKYEESCTLIDEPNEQ